MTSNHNSTNYVKERLLLTRCRIRTEISHHHALQPWNSPG